MPISLSEEQSSELEKLTSDCGYASFTELDCQEPPQKKARNHPEDADQVQLSYSSTEMQSLINAQIESNRKRNNESNRIEFLAPRKNGAARTTAINPKLNRREQIKQDIIDNNWGPLDKSNAQLANANMLSNHGSADSGNQLSGLEARVETIEQHTGIKSAVKATSKHRDLYARIKRIEDFMLELEDEAPAVARKHFHALIESQKRSSSKEPSKQLAAKKKDCETPVKVVRAANTSSRNSSIVTDASSGSKNITSGKSTLDSTEDEEEEPVNDEELNKRIDQLKE